MNSSIKNYLNLNLKHKKIIFCALIGVLIFAIGSVGIGFTENKLILENGHLEITGQYGEEIPLSDIQLIELTEKRPSLRRRINGFSLASRKKGFFRTNSGEKIKAIINSNARPWILITKKSGDKIYFSSNGKSNQSLYQELKKTLPNKGNRCTSSYTIRIQFHTSPFRVFLCRVRCSELIFSALRNWSDKFAIANDVFQISDRA